MTFCMIDREEKFPQPLQPLPPLPSASRKSEPSSLRGNGLPSTTGSRTISMTLVLLLNLKYFPVSATLCGSFFRRSAIFKEEFQWLIIKTATSAFRNSCFKGSAIVQTFEIFEEVRDADFQMQKSCKLYAYMLHISFLKYVVVFSFYCRQTPALII